MVGLIYMLYSIYMTALELQGPVRELQEIIANQKGFILAGAGVTISAIAPELYPLANWKGLVRNGIAYCRDFDFLQEKVANRLYDTLEEDDIESLLSTTDHLRRILEKNDSFENWLESIIKQFTIQNNDLLEAIKGLNLIIATTNYDNILKTYLNRDIALFTEEGYRRVLKILKKEEEGIIHLHGHYSSPSTIVFSAMDYYKISSNYTSQFIEQFIATGYHIIFIGCGLGIEDDNIGGLIKWMSKVINKGHHHYILLNEQEYEIFKKIKNNSEVYSKIIPISYGANHKDLPTFLSNLKKSP